MPSPTDMLAAWLATLPAALSWREVRPSSLDQLRSELAHEPAARLALLAGIVRDWNRGRFRPEDPSRCRALLGDLAAIYGRYGALAAVSGPGWRHLLGVRAAIRSLDAACRACEAAGAPDATGGERLADDLQALRSRADRLVDALTRCYAVDLGEVVRGAVSDLDADPGGGPEPAVPVALTVAPDLGHVWLPRADGDRWRDVLRNLLRNAVQATRERWPAGDAAHQPVRLDLRRLAAAPGVRVEIADTGVGMDAAQLADLWVSGAGRHGPGRGQGLTEAKRAFVEASATLKVASAVGAGTTVTLDFAPRDIEIPASRPWRRPPLRLAALLLVVVVAAAAVPVLQRPREATSTQVVRGNVLRGLGLRGDVLWERELGRRVLVNDHLALFDVHEQASYRDRPSGRLREVLVASAAEDGGPGELTFLDGRGRVLASREVGWRSPRGATSADLGSFWQAPVAWRGGPERAYVADVRLERRAPVSIRVVTAAGADLGAYHHPGHVRFFACDDFDGDGGEEFLLYGINNDAWRDSLLVGCPRGAWHGCAMLLAPPPWDGQAYPGHAWDDLPAARERAYLVLPPLDCGRAVQGQVAVVERDSGPTADGIHLLLRLQDGRVVKTDGGLRPVAFTVGDVTLASQLEAAGELPALRAAYFRDGKVEVIDVPREDTDDE